MRCDGMRCDAMFLFSLVSKLEKYFSLECNLISYGSGKWRGPLFHGDDDVDDDGGRWE